VNLAELKEEIAIEIQILENTVHELTILNADVSGKEPTVREKTAAAAFLAQFYGGIENVLKRISKYHNVLLPTGDTWHVELFKQFCAQSKGVLPILFDSALERSLVPFRKFRHVVFHGYGFQMDWDRMKIGVDEVEDIFNRFRKEIEAYLHRVV